MDKWEKLQGKAITACGGILKDPDRYPTRVYRNRKIYFCNQDCLKEFEEDPDGFMSGKIVHPIARQN